MDLVTENERHNELIDLKEKCRICLQSGTEMNPFFEIYFEDLTLANVFKTITSYEVNEDDRLPKNICESCSEVVISFNNMISVFQENEDYLNKLLCQVVSTNDRKSLDHDDDAEFVNTELDTNGNLGKIEYFDESNVDNIIEYREVDDIEYYEDGSPENHFEENCTVEETAPTEVENHGKKEEFYKSEPHTDTYEIIGNGETVEFLTSPENHYDDHPNVEDCSRETDLTEVESCTKKEKIYKKEPYTDKYEIIGNGDYNRVLTVKYSCECGDCFLHKAGFRQHMQSKHNNLVEDTDLDQYASEIKLTIPTGFPNNMEYVPSRINARKNKLQCRICTLCFSSAAEVKQHEEIHKTHVCHQCGAAFLKKHYLTDHLLIHSDDRHYKCKICSKTFRHRHTLSVHKRTHDVAKSFVCETCGAGFRARCTLYTHKRLKHTNERNFACTACNLRFNLKSTLDKHFFRKHTNNREKSFICTKCGAAYLNKTTLTRHVAEKHLGKAKTYPCNICENKVYALKKSLRAHLQNKHNIF